jgi:parallel beta-helix repeat protein
MNTAKILKIVISAYVVIAMITGGFIGLLIFEGVVDEGGVRAVKTLIVDPAGGGDCTTIRYAMDNASDGDTIRVWAGSYTEDLYVNKSVKLIGNGTSNTTINGGISFYVVRIVNNSVSFSGFTVNGSSKSLYLDNVNNVTVNNNLFKSTRVSLSNSDHNKIENNTFDGFGFVGSRGIEVSQSDYNTIKNNTIWDQSDCGIYLSSSIKNTVFNNTIKNCLNDGIGVLFNSRSNTIINNTCSNNPWAGISLTSSTESNKLIGNYLSNNSYGISLNNAVWITIEKNIMVKCGIRLEGFSTSSWDTHTIETSNTVNGKPVYYWKNVNSGTVPAGAGQVILALCNNVIIENQNCGNGTAGITLGYSYNNIIRNNFCSSNYYTGIDLDNSWLNNIHDNNVGNNQYGIRLLDSNTNTIKDNTCDTNGYGIYLNEANSNKILKNTGRYNTQSSYYSRESDLNTLDYNTFYYNINGISLIENCYYNNITNNSLKYNDYGLNFHRSIKNKVLDNNIMYNDYGIYLRTSSNGNHIINNTIGWNTIYGFNPQASYNFIYHNNIISNAQQTFTGFVNIWNNSKKEGNYWSDYTGVDNGAFGRVDGDGIGDTNLPHAFVDTYPYVNENGWLYPFRPALVDPGNIDTDGTYNVSWNINPRTTGFVLEEDTINTFTAPTELYNGTALSFEIKDRTDDIYYYRLKAYNDDYKSGWSSIVDMKVDWPPSAPKNLRAVDILSNQVTLEWDLNPESDIGGYYIMRSENTSGPYGPFKRIQNEPDTSNRYIVTSLADETLYHFAIVAYDGVPSNSSYSNIVTITTLDSTAPAEPVQLTAEALNNHEIMLEWRANNESDLAGYHIFMNDTDNGPTGNFHLIHTINGLETSYKVTGLVEQVLYIFRIKAFDEVPNNSSFSKFATATTPDKIKPAAPKGLKINGITHNSISLSWDPNTDHDLEGYIVFRSLQATKNFYSIHLGLINKTQYTDKNLAENTTYYYKLMALDDVNLESDFSEIASGKTTILERSPVIFKPVKDFSIAEDSFDNTTINLYKWFKDDNNDALEFRCEGQLNIKVTIFQANGTVVLEPKPNWNGKEKLFFYATDGMFNVTDNVTVTISGVNDPPGPARIITPKDGAVINKNQGLDFEGECGDPDLIYGDKLFYKWKSSILGQLGSDKNISVIFLPVGKHVITFEVMDKDKAIATTTINLTVEEETEEDIWEAQGSTFISSIMAVVVIIIIVIVLLLWLKRKKGAEKEKEPEDKTAVPKVEWPEEEKIDMSKAPPPPLETSLYGEDYKEQPPQPMPPPTPPPVIPPQEPREPSALFPAQPPPQAPPQQPVQPPQPAVPQAAVAPQVTPKPAAAVAPVPTAEAGEDGGEAKES